MDSYSDIPGADKTLPAGTVIAERYHILKPLGTGGMGAVYLAADRVLGDEKVAIKILHGGFTHDPTQLARFLREVQLMRKVNHKNVVRTYDVGTDRDFNYFTMEFVPGTQLEKIIGQNGATCEHIADYAMQICEALQAIHAANIIHRDLKPGNILVLDDGTLRITDFGVARPEISTLTAHDEIVGSVCYIAPEIWLGKKLTHSVDLYALGIILYELATGNVPFDGESPAVLMRAHLDKAPVPPKKLNPKVEGWLNKLILRLLAKSVNDRPRDAKEVIEYLKLHAGTHSGDQTGAHGTVTPFMEELENKSRILTTIQLAEDEDAPRANQQQLSVMRRKHAGSANNARAIASGPSGLQDIPGRVVHAGIIVGAMSLLTWALAFAASALLPQMPELTTESDLLSRAEVLGQLTIPAVLTLVAPYAMLYFMQLSIPALLIGCAAGSNTHALRAFFASIAFLALCFCVFVGYFLVGAPGKEHLTGVSLLSAMITAKDLLSSVAFLSPLTTVYEQIVIGNGMIQSPTAIGPTLGNSVVFIAFLVYVGGIGFFMTQCAREARGTITRIPLLIGVALVLAVMTEPVFLRVMESSDWTRYWQIDLRLPKAALAAGLAHWIVIFFAMVFATLRPATKRRLSR